jgi:hypothetical protein
MTDKIKKCSPFEMRKNLLLVDAVKQFKGVWPDEDDTHLYKFTHGFFETGIEGGNAELICTREQFKSFVVSLFDVAPEDAEVFTSEDRHNYACFYKEEYKYMCLHGQLNWHETKHTVFEPIIIRPTKKLYIGDTPDKLKKGVTPQAPYMPKVGEECEYRNPNGVSNAYYWMFFVGYDKDGSMVIQRKDKSFRIYRRENNLIFRPIITERQQPRRWLILRQLRAIDANLIAAAPEMYAMLADLYNDYSCQDNYPSNGKKIQKREIQDLLAKARGEV